MKNLIFTFSILFTVLSFSQKTDTTVKEKPVTKYNFYKSTPLYILDGKTITEKFFKTLDPNKIKSINVLKQEKATFIYGEKAKNGAIVIVSKAKKELEKERRKS